MIMRRMKMYPVILLMLFIVPAMTAHAADHGMSHGQPVLEGYSPVSYYERGRPERGSGQYQSTYRGDVYWFTSAEQKNTFDANPSAYAPAFPRSCPYPLAQGRHEAIDPTNFKIVDGQLLLFHSSPEQDGRKRWEESIVNTGVTEKELLRRAKSNFINLKF